MRPADLADIAQLQLMRPRHVRHPIMTRLHALHGKRDRLSRQVQRRNVDRRDHNLRMVSEMDNVFARLGKRRK
jgi:hypothetical protein